jgi:hypothetical protein
METPIIYSLWIRIPYYFFRNQIILTVPQTTILRVKGGYKHNAQPPSNLSKMKTRPLCFAQISVHRYAGQSDHGLIGCCWTVTVFFTPTLQKSRMLQIQDAKGEAVVIYREPLATLEMRYHRLSRRVKNMTKLSCGIGIHRLLFPWINTNLI